MVTENKSVIVKESALKINEMCNGWCASPVHLAAVSWHGHNRIAFKKKKNMGCFSLRSQRSEGSAQESQGMVQLAAVSYGKVTA